MLETIVLVAAGVLTGLHAGLLYDFSIDVVPSMRKLDAKRHIEMFQSIDKTITNPVFMLSFLGPIILLPVATFLARDGQAFSYLLAAVGVQIFGCNAVTMTVHLPLNAELAKVDTHKISDTEAQKVRLAFQGPGSKWMTFHMVRTLAGATATALVLIACLKVT